jgi:site-specific DNA-methyltransferase (adenine-specific)
MKNTVKINSAELVHADSLEYIKTLPDNSLDAIITDPPYYRVKANAWDNQWPSVTDYLAWLDEFFAEFWRVLKPAGSLYVFCGPKLSSDTELLLRDRFNVLNHIVWAKPSGRWNGARKEGSDLIFRPVSIFSSQSITARKALLKARLGMRQSARS